MRTDELWCNGSTTDSDSVCLGSNPGSSTKVPLLRGAFFLCGGWRWGIPQDAAGCAEMSRGRAKFGIIAFFYVKNDGKVRKMT